MTNNYPINKLNIDQDTAIGITHSSSGSTSMTKWNLFWDWKIVQFQVGDVNTDGAINIYDLLLIGDILNENQTLSNSLEHIADLNGNNEIELTDIYLLLYIITGVISN